MTTDLLVLGECNPDVIVRGVPEVRFGQVETMVGSTTVTLGSSGVITACAAARLGLRVAFVGVVGDDLLGRFMLDGLAAHGVDTTGVRVSPDLPTGSTIVLERAGDRALLTHMGSIGTLTAADVSAEALSDSRHLHISSWFLQDGLAHGGADLLAAARAAGATTSIDPNWDPRERWEVGPVAASVDLFLPNEQELLAITGTGSVSEGLAAWRGSGALGVAVKCGPGGARAQVGGTSLRVRAPAVKSDSLVDTTGAGDNFNAALICGLLRGLDPHEAVRSGVAAGTLSTAGVGGTGRLPSWDEVRSLAATLPA